MPLMVVLVPLETSVPLVARFVGSQAVFGKDLALSHSLLLEPVPSVLNRTRACLAPAPELRSALTGRSSGQPSSRMRILTAAAPPLR